MLVYTFRTYPNIKLLKRELGDVFVFSKLKADMALLEQRLLDERPELVLGIAAVKGASRLEPTTINRFDNGEVLRGGPAELSLFAPPGIAPIAEHPTHTFCNWTMYRLQHFIHEQRLNTKLMFIHANREDVPGITRKVLAKPYIDNGINENFSHTQ